MNFLFASDSLKGTLSSAQTIDLLTRAAKSVFPDCTCRGVPVADGGEGTTDAVLTAVGGEKVAVDVTGPLGEPVRAFYGKLDETRAVMEMSSASGLPLVPEGKQDPRTTTTYGTGELIRAMLDAGFTEISIALGGSATNDGGLGCMRALGVRFLDGKGAELSGCGADLRKLAQIDLSGLDPRVRQTAFTLMCDVTNPLCGPRGATYTYGAQKGGTEAVLAALEAGMENYRDVLRDACGFDADAHAGSGAAGGLGAALMAFLDANVKSGIDSVLDLIDFDGLLAGTDLVVTGEGRLDGQSCYGKVVQGVGKRCQAHQVPAVALVGSMGAGAEEIYADGIEGILTTVNDVMPMEQVLAHAQDLYLNGAIRLFRLIRTGMKI